MESMEKQMHHSLPLTNMHKKNDPQGEAAGVSFVADQDCRSTPPWTCITCRRLILFLLSTLFSTTVEKKGATTRWRSRVTLLLPRGTRPHHTAVLKAFPGVYTVKVPSSDWSDQRFNLQDEESRIPRYDYRSQLRLAHRAHPRSMHRRRYLHLRGIYFFAAGPGPRARATGTSSGSQASGPVSDADRPSVPPIFLALDGPGTYIRESGGR